jgi:hypothetical protein
MKPSPFLGLSTVSMESTFPSGQLRMAERKQQTSSALQMVCLFLLVLVCFNTLYSVMMAYKNTIIAQENLELIRENKRLVGVQQFLMLYLHEPKLTPTPVLQGVNPPRLNATEVETLARMTDIRLPAMECPPCTTEKPGVVQPHKNPVSILNEQTQFAVYVCQHICLNPPIHLTTLALEGEPGFQGQTFQGKGASKSESKQVAAYWALEFGYPDKLEEIAEEYRPNLEYNPPCNDPRGTKFPEPRKC